MPAIVFDLIVPTAEFAPLLARFEKLAARASEVESATVTVAGEQGIVISPDVLAELRALGSGVASRITVHIDAPVRSVNQLAMLFSRLLTPQADLPAEPVLLHDEQAHEVAPLYPWTVAVHP
ncbi:hypothetical protein QVA66_01960 [Staphylococcus chromogenes]|nr:hypothetical protein [Staphylococcus chromogenes]